MAKAAPSGVSRLDAMVGVETAACEMFPHPPRIKRRARQSIHI
jgi:hypothetical protein